MASVIRSVKEGIDNDKYVLHTYYKKADRVKFSKIGGSNEYIISSKDSNRTDYELKKMAQEVKDYPE